MLPFPCYLVALYPGILTHVDVKSITIHSLLNEKKNKT